MIYTEFEAHHSLWSVVVRDFFMYDTLYWTQSQIGTHFMHTMSPAHKAELPVSTMICIYIKITTSSCLQAWSLIIQLKRMLLVFCWQTGLAHKAWFIDYHSLHINHRHIPSICNMSVYQQKFISVQTFTAQSSVETKLIYTCLSMFYILPQLGRRRVLKTEIRFIIFWLIYVLFRRHFPVGVLGFTNTVT